jgi:hypothetical protein
MRLDYQSAASIRLDGVHKYRARSCSSRKELLMTVQHQTARPWEWHLASGALARIDALALPRWLELQAGRVWLTQTVSRGETPADVWLQAGERVLLPAGTRWLVEAAANACLATHVPGSSTARA